MNETIVLATDDLSIDAMLELVQAIGPRVYAVKIHEAYDAIGPGIVLQLKQAGARRVWMDAKLHDIPNTVRLRSKAYAEAEIDIISVHASGGVEMMRKAKEGAPQAEIYAITVLTSLSPDEAQRIYGRTVEEEVRALAHLAKEAGVHGVVCSPQEVGMLKSDPALAGLKFVIPGTRSVGAEIHDQKRVTTPREAVDAGASLLVVGRQITTAGNPREALDALELELTR
jgi:orotidine-5'-phosphate decarboxylase